MARRASANDRVPLLQRAFLRERRERGKNARRYAFRIIAISFLSNQLREFVFHATGVRAPFFHHFSLPFSPGPLSPECHDFFFYVLLVFVYLKLRNILRHARDNIERVHVPYFYTIKDYKKAFLVQLLYRWYLLSSKGFFSRDIKGMFLSCNRLRIER